MPDLFRLVTIDDVGRARLLVDLNDPATSGVYRERDTFQLVAAEGRTAYAQGSSRYAGSIAQADLDDNDTVTTGLVVRATDPAAAAATIERLLAYMDRLGAACPTWLEWRPAGLPRSVFFPVRGPGAFTPLYAARVWEDAKAFRCTVSWPVAPLAEGLPMDLTEDFRAPPDKRGGIVNLVPNPSGEIGTAGWVGNPGGYWNNGGTITTAVGTAARGQVGAVMLRVQTPGAAASEGAGIAIPGVFKAGRTYLVRMAANNNGGTNPSIQAVIGSVAGGDGVASVATGAMGGAGIIYMPLVFYTPTVDRVDVVAGVRTAATVAADIYIDQIIVADVTGLGLTTATAVTTPAYLDGDGTAARWEGVPHSSRSIEVAENMLADFTVDAGGGGIHVRQDVANGRDAGLWTDTPATELRMRHAGRGYGLADGAVAIGLRMPDALTATFTTVKAGKIVGGANGNVVYAWLDVNNAIQTLYVIRVAGLGTGGAVQTNLVSATPSPALVAAGRYWVRLVVHGRYARAEYWTTDPVRGGAPATATAWTDVGAGYGLDGVGEAVYGFLGGQASARATALHEHPYSFADVKSPDEVLLRGVPGNAPARADVEVAAAAGTTLPFGMIGWRPRPRVHNIAWNGNLEDDTDGWSASVPVGLNAGAAIARNATGGPTGDASLGVTSSASVVATGAAFTTYERIRRGRTYAVEFWANGADLANWVLYVILDAATAINVTTAGALSGGAVWTRYVVTFVAPSDAGRLDFIIRRDAASANTVNVARLRVYEGAVAADPDTAAQADGRGAWAPFGLIMAASDDISARAGASQVTNANAPGGQGLQVTGNFVARWPIDPALLLGTIDDTVIDVEVYAMLAVPSTVTGGLITLSAMPEKGPGRRVYTREYGGAGRSILRPSAGTTHIAHRLGTLPLEVGRRSTGRWQLIIDSLSSTGVVVLYLVVVPVLKRQGSPTGKVNDTYYPTFATFAANTPGKLFESSGRGFALAAQGGVYRDSSIGGEPIEPDPGDNELLVWTFVGGVPDQPDGATGTPAETTLTRVRARVTPRYRLMRDA